MSKTTAEERILASVDEGAVLEKARDLVRRPSVNPPGDYAGVAAYVEEVLRGMGLEVERVEGDSGRPNVVGLLRGAGGGPAFCLSSHMDVVDPGDGAAWRFPPFEGRVEEGFLWGRGSADSKGMLAGMLEACRAIKSSGVKLRGDLYLVAAVDDETAGRYGLRYVFQQGVLPARSAILGEATDFNITHIFKGRIWFELDTLGKASHGAFPERGVNAILKAYKIIEAIYGIELGSHPRLGKDTISLGTIRGGRAVNVGPESCATAFDIRWAPPLKSRDIRAKVEQAVGAAVRADGEFQAGDIRASEERDPLEFPEDAPVIRTLQSSVPRVRGREAELIGWYSSGEIYHMLHGGHIDVGVIFGPGEPAQAHAVNERIAVKDLVDGAKVYALAALSMCGGGAP